MYGKDFPSKFLQSFSPWSLLLKILRIIGTATCSRV
jgi:hypothetical protein